MGQYSESNMKYTGDTCFKEEPEDYTSYIMIVPKAILFLLYENILFIGLFFILHFVFKIIYRCYWNPYYFKKELSEIGFEHIPAGRERDQAVSRAQTSRNYGTNIPPPYPNGWYEIADSSAVKKGATISVDALGQDLCVYRGEDKIARCVDAYCPHLGANLGVGGSVRGNCIECPFHKWRFSGDDGACVHVPGLEQAPKGISVKQWTTKEANGAIWIWYDAENREPLWELNSAPELATWGFRGANEYYASAHIQDIPENGADNSHFNAIHSASVLCKLGKKYPVLNKYIGYHIWSSEWTKDGHISNVTIKHNYKIMNSLIFRKDLTIQQIGPGQAHVILTSILGPILLCQSQTPLGPKLQRVVQRFYSPTYNAVSGLLYVLGGGAVFEDDVNIWNTKRFNVDPPYIRTDKTIRLYRNWFSQFYTENSITFKDACQNTLDW